MSFACRIRCCKKLTFYDILLGCATILVRSVFKGTIARLAKNRIEFIWRDKTWLQVKLNPFDVIHLNFYSRLERRRRRQPQTSIKVHWIQRLGRMKLIHIHFFPARQTIDVKRRNEVLNCNERVDGWQWQGTREWLKPHRNGHCFLFSTSASIDKLTPKLLSSVCSWFYQILLIRSFL